MYERVPYCSYESNLQSCLIFQSYILYEKALSCSYKRLTNNFAALEYVTTALHHP